MKRDPLGPTSGTVPIPGEPDDDVAERIRFELEELFRSGPPSFLDDSPALGDR